MSSAQSELEAANLEAITELDSQLEISQLNNTQSSIALLDTARDQEDPQAGRGLGRVPHDLAPVHNVLVNLAESLQLKVDTAIRDLMEIRMRLAREMFV